MAEWGSFNNNESIEQFREVRCAYVNELFAAIRDEGYRPNYAAAHRVPDVDVRNRRYRFFHRLEPLVAIGRDGTLFWVDGYHRATIAKLLGIDSIPVNVLCRHAEWQRRRDLLFGTGSPAAGSDRREHPDLR